MKNGTIHFIRHSTTTGIEHRWIYGSTDLPLSEEGYRLLDELKQQGIYPPAGGCDMVTSGMLRANQTLQYIYGDVPFATIPDLREMGVGVYECRTHEELKDRPDYAAWLSDETGLLAPEGGESLHGFAERVMRGFSELLEGAERDTIVVCHGGVIANILYHLYCGVEPGAAAFFTYLPKPARGYTLTIRDGKIADVENI